jgi:hypothetical protein
MVAILPLKERENAGFLKRIKEFSLPDVHPPPESKNRAERGYLIFTNAHYIIRKAKEIL